MARRNNRMQREEIMTLQRFLREWYGIDYQPRFARTLGPPLILLERAAGRRLQPSGRFSRHHYALMSP